MKNPVKESALGNCVNERVFSNKSLKNYKTLSHIQNEQIKLTEMPIVHLCNKNHFNNLQECKVNFFFNII